MSKKLEILSLTKRSTIKVKQKHASMREIAGKVTSLVKKPFGGKTGRKPKLSPVEQAQADARVRLAELEKKQDQPEQGYSNVASAFNSFFYTDEKFISQFEDKEILAYIKASYPNFDPKAGDEPKMRKVILELLNNSNFVLCLMQRYGMTVFEFFKFLFRVDPSVFRGAFINKVQNAIKRKKYASVKQHYYRFTKQTKRAKLSRKA